MKSNQMFPDPNTDPEYTLSKLIEAGSIKATTAAAAVMGATIANGGACPTTGVRCIKGSLVPHILSQQYVCGMGIDTQWWGMHTGLPVVRSGEGMLMMTIPSVACVTVYCGVQEIDAAEKEPLQQTPLSKLKHFASSFTEMYPGALIGQLLSQTQPNDLLSPEKNAKQACPQPWPLIVTLF